MIQGAEERYFVDAAGRYLGAWAGWRDGDGGEHWPELPDGAVEVQEPPADGSQIWNADAEAWIDDPAALAVRRRVERDARIEAERWRFERQASEVRLGLTPTDDIAALDAYVQALRDVPQQPGFPATVNWPEWPA